eukprot:12882894-Prorocentrum_lima.AAC.1
MDFKLERETLPWVAPLKLKSDAPKAILKAIDMLPTLGALRGVWGIQIVRVQFDNGGEFINEQLISVDLGESTWIKSLHTNHNQMY